MPDLTRTELLRIVEEFKSERDAAKRDAMRAFDERNILLNQLVALLDVEGDNEHWCTEHCPVCMVRRSARALVKASK